ncbi:MAG: M16 family metallopeptidase, partial [Candidatus Cryptobacteroides sp.]
MICSTTSGGLRYAVLKEGKRAAYCSLSINSGTRVENVLKIASRGGRYPSGTAHFVEHALFKGTSRHSAQEINGYLERLGGELNAYTTKEEIVLHATVLSEDIRKAADLLFELATEPLFPEDEVQKEKTVILEEIASYKDSPAEDIYDRFESMLFEGHPLCGTILGSASSVRNLAPEQLGDYVREFFIPSLMAFTMVSPLEEEEMAEMVEALSGMYFGGRGFPVKQGMAYPGQNKTESADKESRMTSLPTCLAVPNIFDKTVNRHTHQANCI